MCEPVQPPEAGKDHVVDDPVNSPKPIINEIETEPSVRFVGFGNSVGWFHASWGDTAVLICPGLGRDVNNAYGSLRLLASDLAQLGYPTLRFDYPGTGNAPDEDGQADPAAWLESMAAALDWLKQVGAQQLILCGYRLGGLLAAVTAAQRHDVRAVILLDPVPSGLAYLRELRIASQLNALDAPEHESAAAALEIDGLLLPDSAQAVLKRLDLLLLPGKPAQRMLLLGPHAGAAAAKLPDRLRAAGADVTQGSFTVSNEHDRDGYIRPSGISSAMREWLDATAPPSTRVEPRCRQPDTPVISAAPFIEEPVAFGPGRRLVGLLCRPKVALPPDFVLLIGSTAGMAHPGHARFHVRLARMLAAAGVASLRFDFSGIGESEAGSAGSAHVYRTDRGPDFAAAMDALASFGYRRFGVAGLCSGAYHAWRAGVADERISTAILINPSTFIWRKDQDFAQFISNNTKSAKFYLSSMAHGSGWRRLLRGELNVRRAVRTLRTHTLRHLRIAGGRTMATIGWPTDETRLRRATQRLEARGVRILFLLGSEDFGVDVVRSHFGRLRVPFGHLELLTGVDHSINRIAMQEKVGRAVVAFLCGKSGPDPLVQVEGLQEPAGAETA